MEEIRCPNCGEVFQVDASNYAQILKQVRDKEFDKEIDERVESLKRLGEATIEKRFLEIKQEYAQDLSQKDATIADKEREILLLQAKIDAANTEKDLAVEPGTGVASPSIHWPWRWNHRAPTSQSANLGALSSSI